MERNQMSRDGTRLQALEERVLELQADLSSKHVSFLFSLQHTATHTATTHTSEHVSPLFSVQHTATHTATTQTSEHVSSLCSALVLSRALPRLALLCEASFYV